MSKPHHDEHVAARQVALGLAPLPPMPDLPEAAWRKVAFAFARLQPVVSGYSARLIPDRDHERFAEIVLRTQATGCVNDAATPPDLILHTQALALVGSLQDCWGAFIGGVIADASEHDGSRLAKAAEREIADILSGDRCLDAFKALQAAALWTIEPFDREMPGRNQSISKAPALADYVWRARFHIGLPTPPALPATSPDALATWTLAARGWSRTALRLVRVHLDARMIHKTPETRRNVVRILRDDASAMSVRIGIQRDMPIDADEQASFARFVSSVLDWLDTARRILDVSSMSGVDSAAIEAALARHTPKMSTRQLETTLASLR